MYRSICLKGGGAGTVLGIEFALAAIVLELELKLESTELAGQELTEH